MRRTPVEQRFWNVLCTKNLVHSQNGNINNSQFGNFSLDFHIKFDYICHMTVIGIKVISDAIRKHADARTPLQSWLAEAKEDKWKNSQDIKRFYKTASFLSDNKVIFNIGGKKYRLVVQLAYKAGIVEVLWFGTHAEYSKKKF